MTTERRLPRRLAVAVAFALACAGTGRAGQVSGLSLGARGGCPVPVGDASAAISPVDVRPTSSLSSSTSPGPRPELAARDEGR